MRATGCNLWLPGMYDSNVESEMTVKQIEDLTRIWLNTPITKKHAVARTKDGPIIGAVTPIEGEKFILHDLDKSVFREIDAEQVFKLYFWPCGNRRASSGQTYKEYFLS